MSYLYRCTKRIYGVVCGARRSLKRKVEDYIRVPKCRTCGHPLTYLDNYQKRRNKENTCRCDGEPYPHRAGSTVWCRQHPTGPTEADYREAHGYAPE